MNINWLKEVEKRRNEIISDTKDLLKIPSVLTENLEDKEAPFGQPIRDALDFMLDLGNKDNFEVKNVENVAGHIEYGRGEEIVGILCHLDVVPTGDGWKYSPFSATEVDGKIYARGAIDDKGPTMAAYYALKMIRDLDLKLSKKIRIILGTDEETGWRGVKKYFESEKMPDIGFAPDANFPMIYGEKGIINVDITGNVNDSILNYFAAGERYNVVPDKASASLNIKNSDEFVGSYNKYLQDKGFNGSYEVKDGVVTLHAVGKNAHAMQPEKGLNAAFILLEFLNQEINNSFVKYMCDYLTFDDRANKYGINYNGDVMGDLTNNVGILEYNDGDFKIGLNFRYPIDWDKEKGFKVIKESVKEVGFNVEVGKDSKPHFVDPSDDLIKTLHDAYIKYTGDKDTKIMTIGGGTYSRAMKKAVAFGPLMPNREDVVHQPNEYLIIDDFIKTVAIYAEAIYALAK